MLESLNRNSYVRMNEEITRCQEQKNMYLINIDKIYTSEVRLQE